MEAIALKEVDLALVSKGRINAIGKSRLQPSKAGFLLEAMNGARIALLNRIVGIVSSVDIMVIAEELIAREQVGVMGGHIHQLTLLILLLPAGFYDQGGIHLTRFFNVVAHLAPELMDQTGIAIIEVAQFCIGEAEEFRCIEQIGFAIFPGESGDNLFIIQARYGPIPSIREDFWL